MRPDIFQSSMMLFGLMMIQKLFQLESRNVTYYVINIENKTKIEQPQFASVDLHVY